MSENNSQTQNQISALRTLQESYDILATNSAAGAKQGTNANATLSITQAAVVDGNDTAVSVSKDVRSEVGTGSDTAAETGTLFAVVKWVKDKVKDVYSLIGYTISEIDGI